MSHLIPTVTPDFQFSHPQNDLSALEDLNTQKLTEIFRRGLDFHGAWNCVLKRDLTEQENPG